MELRDINCPKPEEFWKARARCLGASLNGLGTREELIRRYELFVFHSENPVARQSSEDLEQFSEASLERYANSKWVNGTSWTTEVSEELNTAVPWKVVPEVAYMQKRVAAPEVLKAIGALMRPTFCFYNHVSGTGLAERLVAFAFLPAAPHCLSQAPEALVKHLASALGLTSTAETKDVAAALERQKLLEAAYCVLDSEALHGVTYCHTEFSVCRAPASGFCANFMCPVCCSLHQTRLPCGIHDSNVQFLRFRLRQQREFESQLDPFSTLKLCLNEPIRKIQLYRVFEGFAVRWDKVMVWYHPNTQRISCLYLSFVSQSEAQRAYLQRKLLQDSGLRLTIRALPEPLFDAVKRFKTRQVSLDCVLMFSEITSEKKRSLPSKTHIVQTVLSLSADIAGVSQSELKVDIPKNPLSGNFHVQEFYVHFPSAKAAEAVFASQPFRLVVAHKLSHLIPFPFLRPSASMCLQCPRAKECLHDLCGDCCPQFRAHPSYSCSEHASRNSVLSSRMPLHVRRMFELPPSEIARKIPEKVGQFHIAIRYLLEEGVYSWFRPKFYLEAESMKAANTDLQIVLDSNTTRQNLTTTAPKREGKLFNYSYTQPLTFQQEGKLVTEALDNEGRVFLEYCYAPFTEADVSHNWEEAGGRGQMYTRQDMEDDTCHIGFSIRNSFHVFIAGLDPYKKGLKELLAAELKSKLGKVLLEEIIFIDYDSILANLLLVDPSAEGNIDSYNRVAAVKLVNETDALKLILGEVNLTLPLSNGLLGSPIIVPSAELCQYIHNKYEEFMRNPSISIPAESIQDKHK
mmetsp:Transcript_10733/g.20919  ORF Transcript_10733/g.20919 Transcript_10733/m.20919 type:complete len:800 (+) Transcript_10733:279-2678(+)|eukprot:CAMPEP_0204913934 /NCGR_PEP_ID=MMETSP1397-20131031/11805_1 /ASSEMBLY_ACC=CAM_ASM_000891 /TAXON_ID=49980 /ORGANISM="Climacostomum Climacostomum virens, Strain Stock W-24" /LENGTH=799 /DNA_ID=CAMNT_0052085305 /DNA_START=231 /DNA_END=2630 /DNA_ORIENTATION=+